MHPESGRYRVCHKGVSHTAPYLPGESTGVIKKFSSLEYDILNLYLHDLQMLKKIFEENSNLLLAYMYINISAVIFSKFYINKCGIDT